MTMATTEIISRSPEETLALGEQWGRAAQPGWVLGLSGELGAGKSQLVRGIARGLGVSGRIQSPTFTLVHEYRTGRLPLYHLDLYRLDSPSQVVGAGLEQYFFQNDGVSVIEWIERWPTLAEGLRRVQIDSLGETERRIRYEDFGS